MQRCLVLAAILGAVSGSISAQSAITIGTQARSSESGVRRFELGTVVADIRTNCIGQSNCSVPSFGAGLSGAINLTPHFALDATYLMTAASGGSTNQYGGRASELLVGARAEVRARHYGYYAKVQPGYFRWSNEITSVTFGPAHSFAFGYGPSTSFAAVAGGGIEYSPGSRVHLRAEITDLVIHFSSIGYSNNLQPSAGVYFGVGKPLLWEPPIYEAKRVQPFGDASNIALFASYLMATTADSVTTQRFVQQGIPEADPFARPLVKYGWSGQISLIVIESGAVGLGMYGLHRIHQHWIERLLPVGVATTHAVFAYKNTEPSGVPAN